MSTTIFEKYEADKWKYIKISRHALGANNQPKCGYGIVVNDQCIEISASEMQDMMKKLNDFFKSEGYPS